jgi:hypothetical protein
MLRSLTIEEFERLVAKGTAVPFDKVMDYITSR